MLLKQDLVPFDDVILHFDLCESLGIELLEKWKIAILVDPHDGKRFILYNAIHNWLTLIGGAMDGSRQYNDCSLLIVRNDGSAVAHWMQEDEATW